jgi:hypothetical protein
VASASLRHTTQSSVQMLGQENVCILLKCIDRLQSAYSLSVLNVVKIGLSQKQKEKNSRYLEHFKIRAFGAGGVAQVIQHLPSKLKVLSFNSSTTKIVFNLKK